MAKITLIEVQKNNKHRFSLYLDEKFFCGIHEDILIKFRLAKGMDIDEDFIENVIKSEEQNKANNYALNLLGFKSRSENEISIKMKDKGYEEFTINETLNFLKKHNYINDTDYAHNFTKEKINLSKVGKNKIKLDLYKKGINKEIIQEVIKEHIDEDSEYEKALELGIKKLESTYKKDDKNAQYRKLGGFLQRKGFDFDIISKVLNKLLKNNSYE